jgi:transposase
VGEIIGYLWKLFCGWPGRWHTVYQRFNRWCRRGVWESLFKVLNQDADFEYILDDSTIMRAHQHSAGAPKKAINPKTGLNLTRCDGQKAA